MTNQTISPNSPYTYESTLYNVTNFVIENTPNKREIGTTVFIKSALELFLAPRLPELIASTNPAAKTFVRDFIKIVPGFLAFYNGDQIGGTKYHSDLFIFLGILGKPACKGGVIYTFTPIIGPELSSRLSNYACEAPSSFLKSISRDIQDRERVEERKLSSLEKFEVFLEHITISDLFEAFSSGITKTLLTDMVGTAYRYSDVQNRIETLIQQYVPLPDSGTLLKAHNYFSMVVKSIVETCTLSTPGRVGSEIPKLVSPYLKLVSQYIYSDEENESTLASSENHETETSSNENSRDYSLEHSFHEKAEDLYICLAGEQPDLII